jgi:peptide deformylase
MKLAPRAPKDFEVDSYDHAVQYDDDETGVLRMECPVMSDEDFDRDTFRMVAMKLRWCVEHDPNSAGMSAPQVGSTYRMMALRLPGAAVVMCNPEIAWASDEMVDGPEGCFSLPNKRVIVKRHKEVKINAVDETGRSISAHLAGLPAIAFQHELDHLSGKMILDHGEAEDWVE